MKEVYKSFNNFINDLTILGIINIITYVIIMFLLIPLIDKFTPIKISLRNYILWYVLSTAETSYIIYLIYGSR